MSSNEINQVNDESANIQVLGTSDEELNSKDQVKGNYQEQNTSFLGTNTSQIPLKSDQNILAPSFQSIPTGEVKAKSSIEMLGKQNQTANQEQLNAIPDHEYYEEEVPRQAMTEAGFKFSPGKDDDVKIPIDPENNNNYSGPGANPNADKLTIRSASERDSRRKGPPGADKKVASSHSLPSSSIAAKFSNAREVSETFTTKLASMTWSYIAIVVNIVLLYYFVQMGTGLVLPIAVESVSTVGTVIIEIVLILANLITFRALNDGAAAFFGSRLAEKRGYSIAAIGFVQTSGLLKFGYCNELSLNSTCRRFLSRISLIWIFLELVNILSPFAATSITGENVRIDDGFVNCIEFGQNFSPVDRLWPTDETEQGFAELIFGTALGLVRSQDSSLNDTTAVMTPQIVGAVQDGDTMAGSGFTTNISSRCQCTRGNTSAALRETYPYLSEAEANEMMTQFNDMGDIGLVNHLSSGDAGATVTTMLRNLELCGGRDGQYIQVCKSDFYDHRKALVQIEYMTDGTPASIAAKAVEIREIMEAANTTWMVRALENILNVGEIARRQNNRSLLIAPMELPQTVAGTTNPLLWWTTPNLIMVDLSLLEAGLETTFAILIRAGMQRTFSTKGNTCVKNIAVPGQSTVIMSTYGIQISVFILGFHLLVALLASLAYIPWIISPDPILPAIRSLKDNIYFATLLNSSSINTGFYELCNAPSHAMWQAIDIIARLGESIQTVSEDVGHICLDKPKLVRKLVNGKKYY